MRPQLDNDGNPVTLFGRPVVVSEPGDIGWIVISPDTKEYFGPQGWTKIKDGEPVYVFDSEDGAIEAWRGACKSRSLAQVKTIRKGVRSCLIQ